jgi:hypothetical protein
MKTKSTVAIAIASAIVAATGVYVSTTTTQTTTYKRYDIEPNSGVYNPVHPAPGDTVYLKKGQYDWISWGNISGDSAHSIILMGDSAVMSSGFEFNDCRYWHIAGGITITSPKPVPYNVAFKIRGKSGGFEIENVDFENVYSAIWFKLECNEYKDTSYWSWIMDGLYVHDCNVRHCHFEGFYIGSTDQSCKRPAVASDGKTYYPCPPKVRNIRLKNIYMDSCWRTGIQVSGLDSSDSWIRYCTIRNSGMGHESDQGASFRLGGRSAYFNISNCTFSNSWLYAVQSQGSGLIKFVNNRVDSATHCGSNNPQGMACVQFDNATYPTTLKIKDNIIGWSNTNVAVVIYANKPAQFTADNVYSGNITKGTFVNNTDAVFNAGQESASNSRDRLLKQYDSIYALIAPNDSARYKYAEQ